MVVCKFPVGGFDSTRLKNISQIRNIFPGRGEHKKMLETTT